MTTYYYRLEAPIGPRCFDARHGARRGVRMATRRAEARRRRLAKATARVIGFGFQWARSTSPPTKGAYLLTPIRHQ
jgi:hypothetical protein